MRLSYSQLLYSRMQVSNPTWAINNRISCPPVHVGADNAYNCLHSHAYCGNIICKSVACYEEHFNSMLVCHIYLESCQYFYIYPTVSLPTYAPDTPIFSDPFSNFTIYFFLIFPRSGIDKLMQMFESRGDIIPRPSHLDLDVPISVHPAPDVLSFRFCSCGDSHDNFHGWLEGYFSSSYCGFHLRDVVESFHPS